jgi:2-iminobutanoate/2-iminopropanoate deaminase
MKKAIQIPGAPSPLGPYSQAVLADKTLYISGQIPINPINGEIINESIESATKQVLSNIFALLKEVEMNEENVVKCSIFLKDLNDFTAVNEVYSTYFTKTPPARETVQVAKLPLDVPIEISCIAVKF